MRSSSAALDGSGWGPIGAASYVATKGIHHIQTTVGEATIAATYHQIANDEKNRRRRIDIFGA